MKATASLKVLYNKNLKGHSLVMNPSDGCDLGFMQLNHQIRLYRQENVSDFKEGSPRYMPGSIQLDAGCRMGTIQVSLEDWQLLGRPSSLRLICTDNRVLIAV